MVDFICRLYISILQFKVLLVISRKASYCIKISDQMCFVKVGWLVVLGLTAL